MTNSARLLKITHFFPILVQLHSSSMFIFWGARAGNCLPDTYVVVICCVFVMMELEILQLYCNFSHTLHFWIDISFLENCNVNAIMNMIVLVFMSKHYPWILGKSKDFFCYCLPNNWKKIFSCPPIITIESQMNIKNVSLSLHFFIWTIVGFPFSFSNI